jgi:hypothetical protein
MVSVTLNASLRLLSAESQAPPTPQVTERGADHRIWMRVTESMNAQGKVMYRTNSYTELGTGMHYFKDGQWVETKEEIELAGNGAVAMSGPHKVLFAANINTVGSIDVVTPDNKRLRSQVWGLAYFDGKTAMLIAELKDSIGILVGNNEILYANAFDDVRADVQYIYTAAGLEQNIVLREQLPSPKQFGLNLAETRLQVMTEFFDPPIQDRIQTCLHFLAER